METCDLAAEREELANSHLGGVGRNVGDNNA
jgi:hypothetical protein